MYRPRIVLCCTGRDDRNDAAVTHRHRHVGLCDLFIHRDERDVINDVVRLRRDLRARAP